MDFYLYVEICRCVCRKDRRKTEAKLKRLCETVSCRTRQKWFAKVAEEISPLIPYEFQILHGEIRVTVLCAECVESK